ncbi:MAG: hypothetical protein WCA41_14665, partial [Candidatus Acidiferrum sp.]
RKPLRRPADDVLQNIPAVVCYRPAANQTIVSGLGDRRKVTPASFFSLDRKTITVGNFYFGTTIVTC